MRTLLARYIKPIIDEVPLIAITARFIRDNFRLLCRSKITPLGFKLIGNREMETGKFEPNETKIISKIFDRVDVFINVGANIGYYCCIALQKKLPTIAFEPIGTNLRYLYKNIKSNKWDDKIEIFPMALSNKIGVAEIFGGGTGASLIEGWAETPSQNRTTVPTNTLDNVIGHRFQDGTCFILVDIEGAEMPLLEGATTFFSRVHKPIWMVEISITEHQPKGVSINPKLTSTFQFFWSRGYEAWTADHNIRPVTPDDINHIAKSGINFLGTHNFLFVEKGKLEQFIGSI